MSVASVVVYLPQRLPTSTILSLQLFPASNFLIPSTVKVACSGLPEQFTDETGKINDGSIMVIKLMQVFLADVVPSPINSPLIAVAIWKSITALRIIKNLKNYKVKMWIFINRLIK